MEKIEEDFCFLYVGHWLQGDVGKDRKGEYVSKGILCETCNLQ